MKYKVGDKLKVREDLETEVVYGGFRYVEDMTQSKYITVQSATSRYYTVLENYRFWTDEMIECKVQSTNMKYKIGDKVRVREDLEIGDYYGAQTFEYPMNKFIGTLVTISEVRKDEYLIEEDGTYGWTDEMFEGKVRESKKETEEKSPLQKIKEEILFKKNVIDEFFGIDTALSSRVSGRLNAYKELLEFIEGIEKE
jgi:ribosomal protein S17